MLWLNDDQTYEVWHRRENKSSARMTEIYAKASSHVEQGYH